MADDPGFIFYPGDYLRDTQCLSESSQTAYDRIMCEHMRNICISHKQLKFFTKRLNPEQNEELMNVLTETTAGYQIKWVAESITKRREYSDSRRKNRNSKAKNQNDISSTYVPHMDNVIENEDVNEKGIKDEKEPPPNFFNPDIKGDEIIFPIDTKPVRELWAKWKEHRWRNFQKKYGFYGEQAELKKLEGKTFKELEQIILNAISGKWYNLYGNGKQTNGNNGLTKVQQQQANNLQALRDQATAVFGTKP